MIALQRKSAKAMIALLASFLPFGLLSQSGQSVQQTPHNLRKAGHIRDAGFTFNDYGDVCIYCHASKKGLMWNRSLRTSRQSGPESPKTGVNFAARLDSTSLLCLSCHDNTQPLDAVEQRPVGFHAAAPGNATISTCSTTCHTPQHPDADLDFSGGHLTANPEHHHPVGISFPGAAGGKFEPPVDGRAGGLPLYGRNRDQIGCATCHDPHDNSNRPFLRVANENSALCETCHIM